MTARQTAAPEIKGPWKYQVCDDGLAYQHAGGSGFLSWKDIRRVEAPECGVYLFVTSTQAYVLPSDAFPSADALQAFAVHVARRSADVRLAN